MKLSKLLSVFLGVAVAASTVSAAQVSGPISAYISGGALKVVNSPVLGVTIDSKESKSPVKKEVPLVSDISAFGALGVVGAIGSNGLGAGFELNYQSINLHSGADGKAALDSLKGGFLGALVIVRYNSLQSYAADSDFGIDLTLGVGGARSMDITGTYDGAGFALNNEYLFTAKGRVGADFALFDNVALGVGVGVHYFSAPKGLAAPTTKPGVFQVALPGITNIQGDVRVTYAFGDM
jgi:hypothetical protein